MDVILRMDLTPNNSQSIYAGLSVEVHLWAPLCVTPTVAFAAIVISRGDVDLKHGMSGNQIDA